MARRTLISLVLIVTAAGLIPRLLWAGFPHPKPFSDAEDYHACALGLLEGRGMMQEEGYRAYRPPLYPLFLAGVYRLVGVDVRAAYRAQAILGAISCGLLALLALWLFKPLRLPGPAWWPALACGLGLALFDIHIFMVGVLMSETLFVFLLLGWLLALVEARTRGRWLSIVAAGLLHGLMALCRPLAVAYIPVSLFFLWNCRERSGSEASERGANAGLWRVLPFVLYLAVVVVTIAPWTVRNALVLGRFVPISTNGGVNFYIGHHPGYSYWSTGDKEGIRQATELNEVDESARFFHLGWEQILSSPRQTLVDSAAKLRYLFTTRVPPWPFGAQGSTVGFERLSLLTWVQWGPLLALLALVGALLLLLRDRSARLFGGLVACHLAAVIVFFARSRFRLPLDPLLLLSVVGGLGLVLRWLRERYGDAKPGETDCRDEM